MASGTTNSSSAAHDHTGAVTSGCAHCHTARLALPQRSPSAIASTPTNKAPITGGILRPQLGSAESVMKASTMGAAMATSLPRARTKSSPKRKNTPATMPITMGMGKTDITRLTQPLMPSSAIKALVT